MRTRSSPQMMSFQSTFSSRTTVRDESKGIYVTGEAATPCLFGAHLLPVEDELGLDHRQAVVQVRDVVFVGGSVALQLIPVRLVFEVEGLPSHAVARPVLGIDAAIEDLEDVVLANTLVVMFVGSLLQTRG